MRVLVICVDLPFPAVGGGLMRTYQVLKALAKEHEVTLVGFTYDRDYDSPDIPIEVIPVRWELPGLYKDMHNEEDDDILWEIAYNKLAYQVSVPWNVSYFGSKKMEEQIKSIVSRKEFDLVVIEDTDMAQYIPVLPTGVPRILDLHNVYSLMARRALEVAEDRDKKQAAFELKRTIQFERYVADQCDICFVCSHDEAKAVKELLSVEHVEVIPNGVDTSYFKPTLKKTVPGSLLFTGTMSYEPNVEAICWFVKEVLPAVAKRSPGVTVNVVGTNPVEKVYNLSSANVKIHGRVPDMRPYFEQAEIYIAPILSGGGTRLKILEAAASGKAIVSTSLGAGGIDLKPGEEIMVANTASDFAEAICCLLNDHQKRKTLESLVHRPMSKYDWKTINVKVREVVKRTVQENKMTIQGVVLAKEN